MQLTVLARSRESYKRDPEKSAADSAARSRESYKMKDPEKSRADSASRSRESYMQRTQRRVALKVQHDLKQVMIRMSKQVALLKGKGM